MSIDDEDIKPLFKAILAIVIITTLILIVALIPCSVVSYTSPDTSKIARKEVDPKTEKILYHISYCESRHRQYDERGNVLRGEVNLQDIGRWQINEYWWGEKAEELGFDIYTEEGNRKMAEYILTEGQGIEAWSASKKCLNSLIEYNKTAYGE